MYAFDYQRPTSRDAAKTAATGADTHYLAGGQSLIPVLNMRLASPAVLIDINNVEGLDTLEVSDAGVRVGATVRHAGLEADGAVQASGTRGTVGIDVEHGMSEPGGLEGGQRP